MDITDKPEREYKKKYNRSRNNYLFVIGNEPSEILLDYLFYNKIYNFKLNYFDEKEYTGDKLFLYVYFYVDVPLIYNDNTIPPAVYYMNNTIKPEQIESVKKCCNII